MKKLLLTLIFLLFFNTLICAQNQFGYVNTDNTNVRILPNSDAEVLKVLPFGTKFKILSKKHLKGWYQIQIGKKIGWLNGNTFSVGKLLKKVQNEPDEEYTPTQTQLELDGWYYVTSTKDDSTGSDFYFKKYSIKRTRFGDASVWFKQIPLNSRKYSRNLRFKRNVSYVLQLITAHCDDERMTMDDATFYYHSGLVIDTFPSLSFRKPVIPDSVGEGIYNAICRSYSKTPSPYPKTETGIPVYLPNKPIETIEPSLPKIPSTVSGGVLNGKATVLPKPPYPAAAKAVRAGGAVSVQVTIDEEGNVLSASATSGHPLLRHAAESAARNTKFNPTLLSGQKVRVTGVLTFNFVAQ